MRIDVLLFLLLFFLVITGSNPVTTGVHHNKTSYQPTQNIVKAQQCRLEYANLGLPLIINDNLSQKKDDFISLADDDDDDLIFSRKLVVVAKQFVTLSYTFISVHFCNYHKNRLPFCSHFSYTSSFKYILQRVLRL